MLDVIIFAAKIWASMPVVALVLCCIAATKLGAYLPTREQCTPYALKLLPLYDKYMLLLMAAWDWITRRVILPLCRKVDKQLPNERVVYASCDDVDVTLEIMGRYHFHTPTYSTFHEAFKDHILDIIYVTSRYGDVRSRHIVIDFKKGHVVHFATNGPLIIKLVFGSLSIEDLESYIHKMELQSAMLKKPVDAL